MKEKKFNKYSKILTENKSQGASQAMLYGTGMTTEDMHKTQIGIASMWYDGNTCNMHLNKLSKEIKDSLLKENIMGMRFNTIGVSDGISMGTEGMSYSLQSREIIADSIETVMSAHWYDGLIAVPGCDKNLPGAMIALGRLNRPGFIIYGGTIKAGLIKNRKIDIVNAFQSYGSFLAGNISEEERSEIVRKACPGPGACGGMYTANTMACAIEAMGMSMPYNSSTPADSIAKKNECLNSGKVMKTILEMGIKPRDILNKKSLYNAITLVMALGGSTNAVIHLLAIAHSVDIKLNLSDFQKISDKTPLIADMKPSGTYVMSDLHDIGGTPGVMKLLLENGLIYGDCLTITGKTIQENLKKIPCLNKYNNIITTLDKPIKNNGHIQILTGNLAKDGSVAKITGKEGEKFIGKAKVFDSEEEMIKAVENGLIERGDVIVIRYEGPKGGPGMPEMLKPTSLIMGANLGKDVALITDGRFSGGSHGFIVGHISPEAYLGGVIAVVENGDIIEINTKKNKIDLLVSEEKIKTRLQYWLKPQPKVRKGTLSKYIRNVSSASSGCVTDL